MGLKGTLEGNPALNGQTMAEEHADEDAGQWVDGTFSVINVKRKWKIPNAETKLYGGQQFGRLLAEFREVMLHTEMGEITPAEVATAAGPHKLNTISNLA